MYYMDRRAQCRRQLDEIQWWAAQFNLHVPRDVVNDIRLAYFHEEWYVSKTSLNPTNYLVISDVLINLWKHNIYVFYVSFYYV